MHRSRILIGMLTRLVGLTDSDQHKCRLARVRSNMSLGTVVVGIGVGAVCSELHHVQSHVESPSVLRAVSIPDSTLITMQKKRSNMMTLTTGTPWHLKVSLSCSRAAIHNSPCTLAGSSSS